MTANSGTILIVDDTPLGRTALEALLLDQGYDLLMAENGPQALRMAWDHNPDIILLDVMMPGMDGYEVCERLRDNARTAQIPILLVTALDDRSSRLRGIESGADDFISKPFDRVELRARVRTILQLNRYRRLLAERAQFEWVIAQANDGYLIVDTHDRILYANDRARLYLDLSIERSTPPGSAFFLAAAHHYRPEPAEAWADWPATSEATKHTRYLVRPETVTAQASWLEVKVFDQPAGLDGQRLISLRDVTQQVANRRSERSFHAAISHKLRTPLFSLTLPLNLLLDESQLITPAQVASIARNALNAARRLREEVEDVLNFAYAPILAETDEPARWGCLPPLVARVSAELDLSAVIVTVTDDVHDTALGLSENALEWILRELLENTKKFHPTQSPHVEVTVMASGAQAVTLRVMDDGLTLSPDQLARAWEPYFQGEKYFTGEMSGMGLGLSLVASLVWEANGTCQLYNRAEAPGVVVQITLPVVDRFPGYSA